MLLRRAALTMRTSRPDQVTAAGSDPERGIPGALPGHLEFRQGKNHEHPIASHCNRFALIVPLLLAAGLFAATGRASAALRQLRGRRSRDPPLSPRTARRRSNPLFPMLRRLPCQCSTRKR